MGVGIEIKNVIDNFFSEKQLYKQRRERDVKIANIYRRERVAANNHSFKQPYIE